MKVLYVNLPYKTVKYKSCPLPIQREGEIMRKEMFLDSIMKL